MNRKDYNDLLADILRELNEENGTFNTMFRPDEKMKEMAKYIAAVALVAADRYYSRLTRVEFDVREAEEHLR